MTDAASSGIPLERRIVSGNCSKESPKQYHLIKKCQLCVQYKAKNSVCFGKGHPQMIQTVRATENREQFEVVRSGEVISLNHGYYYYRLKPGSPLLVWEYDKIVMMPLDGASKAATISLAPGTVLERSVALKQVIMWLSDPDEPLMEYVVPKMSKPHLFVKSEVCIGEAVVGEESLESAVDADTIDEKSEVSTKRKHQEPKRKRSCRRSSSTHDRKVISRERISIIPGILSSERASTSPGLLSSERTSTGTGEKGSSGRGGGCMTDPGADRDIYEVIPGLCKIAVPGLPDNSSFPTKEEVQRRLGEKLKACDERAMDIERVIAKANAELEKNNETREAAVADSNAQILAIINRREAYAVYCENLAAQVRAQNMSDRESLTLNLAAQHPAAPGSRKMAPESAADRNTSDEKHSSATLEPLAQQIAAQGARLESLEVDEAAPRQRSSSSTVSSSSQDAFHVGSDQDTADNVEKNSRGKSTAPTSAKTPPKWRLSAQS